MLIFYSGSVFYPSDLRGQNAKFCPHRPVAHLSKMSLKSLRLSLHCECLLTIDIVICFAIFPLMWSLMKCMAPVFRALSVHFLRKHRRPEALLIHTFLVRIILIFSLNAAGHFSCPAFSVGMYVPTEEAAMCGIQSRVSSNARGLCGSRREAEPSLSACSL